MKEVLLVLQMIVSVVLIVLVLLQARGTGLGRTMGMSGGTSFTRRGLEKLVFRATFVFVGLFLVISVLELLF